MCFFFSHGDYCRVSVASVDSHKEECEACGGTGDLLCCSGCPCVFHINCLKPPLYRVPRGDWFCPTCQKTRKPNLRMYRDDDYEYGDGSDDGDESAQSGSDEDYEKQHAKPSINSKICYICKSEGADEEELLKCSDCPRAYHLDCLKMHHAPRHKWSCGRCDESIESVRSFFFQARDM